LLERWKLELIPALCVVTLLATAPLLAQGVDAPANASANAPADTGTLSGVVLDGTGAPIPDVDVFVVNTATGLQRSLRTDTAGVFLVPLLPPGRYSVSAQREGFAAAQANDVLLSVGKTTTIRMSLTVAAVGDAVMVTAEKREERAQDVPISMSVLRGDALDQSTAHGITEALEGVPGVAPNVAVFGGSTNVSIRGVSAAGPVFFGSSPVSYYVDNVPFGLVRSAILPDTNAYDLERVEVLRGPQGTLYGANAQNGVVRILTKDADLHNFDFKFRNTLSTTENGSESVRVDSAVNVPIVTDKVALRATLGFDNAGGWIDRPDQPDANDSRRFNLRAKLNAQPTDGLSLGAQTWVSRMNNGAPNYSPDNKQIPFPNEEQTTQRFDMYGGTLAYKRGAYSIRSSTSYLTYGNDFSYWLPPSTVLQSILGSKVFDEEVNLASDGTGPWRWTSGVAYRNAQDRLTQWIPTASFGTQNDKSESSAVFGDITRRLFGGHLAASAGLRFFYDHVTQTEFDDPANPASITYAKSADFHKLSPKLSLTWLVRDNFTAYTTYSEGFRSGFNQSSNVEKIAPNFPPLKPDNLKNYEVGTKGGLLDGRVLFDVAVYYIHWDDVQQPLTVPSITTDNALLNYVAVNINGVSASGPGFDIGTTFKPAPGLTLSANVGWNDLTQDKDVVAFTFAAPNGVVIFPKGSRLNLSPETTASGSAVYAFAVGPAGYKSKLSSSASYVSSQFYNRLLGASVDVTPGQSLLIGRVSATLDSPHRWSATFFIDNVNNEQNSVFLHWTDVPERNLRVRPRSVGVQIDYGF